MSRPSALHASSNQNLVEDLKDGRTKTNYKIALAFLISVFALPQYFGIPLPAFALTAQRIVLLLILFRLVSNRHVFQRFKKSITEPFVLVCFPFLFVASYTTIFTSDISSIANFLFDAYIPMLVMMYCGRCLLDIEDVFHLFRIIICVVCIAAVVDVIIGWNPFDLLHSIRSISGGSAFRAGSYRSASMCSHPIALGMYLVLMLPMICYDPGTKKINLLLHPLCLFLMLLALLACGSRMPQATFIAEVAVLYLLTSPEDKKEVTGFLFIFLILASIVVFVLRDESHVRRIVILNLYQMIDSVFGTELVLKEFGYWQWRYIQSWDYRNLLPLLFFSPDYDPFLGLGAKAANYSNFSAVVDGQRVASIDNYYVLCYLQYAWPGLASTLLFFVAMLKTYINGIACKIRSISQLSKILCVALLLYLVNLWFVADLQTFKYLFSIFGLFLGFRARERAQQA